MYLSATCIFQHEGFWEVGRTYYGLVTPSSFCPSPRLRTPSAQVSGWAFTYSGPDAPAGILCQQETSCNCSAWGLSISYPTRTLHPKTESTRGSRCSSPPCTLPCDLSTLGGHPKVVRPEQGFEAVQFTAHIGESYPGRKAGGWIG